MASRVFTQSLRMACVTRPRAINIPWNHMQSRAFTKPVRPEGNTLFSMAKKVCLVTGAAQGLGYEFCRAFLEAYVVPYPLLPLQCFPISLL